MSDYIKKYYKYKTKYKNLKYKKNKKIGGNNDLTLENFFNFKSLGSLGDDIGQFNYPTCTAIFPNGDIAVSDSYNKRVQIFNSSGIFLNKIDSNDVENIDFYPYSIAISPNGNIVIINLGNLYLPENMSILIFNPELKLIKKIINYDNGSKKFGDAPSKLIVSPNQDIIVCDSSRSKIIIFDSFGEFKNEFGSVGNKNGELKNPEGLAILYDGNIAVSDTGNKRIQIFNLKGELIDKIEDGVSAFSEIKVFPNGNIALLNDDVYDSNITIIDKHGKFMTKHILTQSKYHISVLTNNKILLTDSINNHIRIIDVFDYKCSDELYLKVDGKNYNPQNIVILPNKYILVTNLLYNSIQMFDLSGKYIKQFGLWGHGVGQYMSPKKMTVTKDENILLIDKFMKKLLIYDLEGNFKNIFDPIDKNIKLVDPWDVKVSYDGNIIVSDKHYSNIQIFDQFGNFITKFGSNGTDKGQFRGNISLACSPVPNGNIIVCDTENNRVQIFSSSGEYIRNLNGQFDRPESLDVLPNGNIVVCDTNNHKIQIFNSFGDFLYSFGHKGNSFDEFMYPEDIKTSPDGKIFVADTSNGRIKILTDNLTIDKNTKTIEKFDPNDVVKQIKEKIMEKNKLIDSYSNNFKISINLDNDIIRQICETPGIIENNKIIEFTIVGEEIGLDRGGITRKILSNISNSDFFINEDGYVTFNKKYSIYDFKVLGYFWSYVIKINEALPVILHPFILLFLTSEWDEYLSIFDNFSSVKCFLDQFDKKIIISYLKTHLDVFENYPELFVETYINEDFLTDDMDKENQLRQSVKSTEGKINIVLRKMKYDYATSIKDKLNGFKSSLYKSFGIDISNIGINLISRILSGDSEITWDKIYPFFTIDNTSTNKYDLATENNKKIIFDVIKSEIDKYPDYPKKLFEALTGGRVMSQGQNYKLSLKLILNSSNTLTDFHTCFGWVGINLPIDFKDYETNEKENLIKLAIGYDALVNEINSKINQIGGNIVFD